MAGLGDEHRPRPVLGRRRRGLAVEHEPREGAEHLADRRHGLIERQGRALEAAHEMGEAQLMVTDELPLVCGDVDQARAAPRCAAAAHGNDRVASRKPEHRREVVLRADGADAGRAAEHFRDLAPREQPDQVEGHTLIGSVGVAGPRS